MGEIQKWEELSRTIVYEKYSRKIEKVVFKMPDGVESDFYIKNEGLAACTLALTPDNLVILVKQYRPGPDAILYELPGGGVEAGEAPQYAACRELKEETGYEGEFEFIGTCLDDAYSTIERHCYVAKNCKKVAEAQQTSTEQTEVVIVSLAEFRKILRSGQMTDVEVGYLGLDYLELLS